MISIALYMFYLILFQFIITTIYSLYQAPRYPLSIPWVGYGKSWSAYLKNYFGGLAQTDKWLSDGYEQYSKHGQSFVLPATIGGRCEVVLPPSQMTALLEQPDSVVSASAAHYEVLHGDLSFITPQLLVEPYHENVIHKVMVKNVTSLLPDIEEEIAHDIDRVYGTSSEWKTINVWDSLFKIVPMMTNRITVGKPLCHNEELMHYVVGFTEDVIRNLLVFALVPECLKKILGLALRWPARYHYWRASHYLIPLIKQRLNDIRRKDAGELKDWQEPNDFITWTIRYAQNDNRPDEMEPNRIAQRLLPVNFASIHTTSITGHSALLDILSCDESVIEELRQEAINAYEGGWSKAGLAKLVKMDSAIRESLRVHGFSQTSVQRLVVKGVTIGGVYYEPGVLVSLPSKPVCFDESIYPDAQKYDPFRFVGQERTTLISTNDKFFVFGHGRHACPGRFLITQELKMMFAYLLVNYDIKRIAARPALKSIGRSIIHDNKFCIEVRRRDKKSIM